MLSYLRKFRETGTHITVPFNLMSDVVSVQPVISIRLSANILVALNYVTPDSLSAEALNITKLFFRAYSNCLKK